MHLADSAFPVGGFAFSSGLESAAKIGLIDSLSTFAHYLEAFVEQVGQMELPYLNSIWDAPDERKHERKRIIDELDATILLPTMNKASILQGKSLFRLLAPMYPDRGIREMRKWFIEADVPCHLLAVITLGMKYIGFRKRDAQRVYVYIMVRDQISSAIRLGLVGPQDGHLLQRWLYDRCEQITEASEGKVYTDAVKTCPALEIAQGYHEQIYTKLFQN